MSFDEIDMRLLAEELSGVAALARGQGYAFGDAVLKYSCNVKNLSYKNFAVVVKDHEAAREVVVSKDEAYDFNPLHFFKRAIEYTLCDIGRIKFNKSFQNT